MKTLNFSDQQVTQIVSDLQSDKGAYSQLMKIFLEAIMIAERSVHNQAYEDKSNENRTRRAFVGAYNMTKIYEKCRRVVVFQILLYIGYNGSLIRRR